MAGLVVFGDVEDELRAHLGAVLPGRGFAVPAFVKRPPELPEMFVYVHRTGGPRRDLVTDSAQITIECYARAGGSPSESEAFGLARIVRALLGALEGLLLGGRQVDTVSEFSGPYNDPDPLAPSFARFSATYLIAVRGEII